MLRSVIRNTAVLLLVGLFAFVTPLQHVVAQSEPATDGADGDDLTELELRRSGIHYFSYDEEGFCGPTNQGGAPLTGNIPVIWKNLIDGVAPKYPDTDPRTVAAALWVENRGWGSSIETSFWEQRNDSNANARGPWQFLPQSWMGWDTGISSWGQEANESAYSSSGMGRDGDGDGFRDPYNPRDSVEAAFVHFKGTNGKPLMEGFSGSAEGSYSNTVTRDTLLYRIALYNGGSGQANRWVGQSLSSLPNAENSNYIKMAYWLIATDFAEGRLVETSGTDEIVDATSRIFDLGDGGGGDTDTSTSTGAPSCGSVIVGSNGYAFPVDAPKSVIEAGVEFGGSTGIWCYRSQGNCHHDYNAADIHAPEGTPVVVTYPGVVQNVRTGDGPGRFQVVGDDGYNYYYTHLDSDSVAVNDGDRVTAGQFGGSVGDAEDALGTAPHLHIDMVSLGRYSDRPSCSGSGCSSVGFEDIQPIMYDLFNNGGTQ